MKATAPDKIYLHPDLDSIFGMTERSCESEIEYTHTDAFIEKAEKWMKENFVNDQGLYCVITDYNTVNEMIEDFKKYMKSKP